MFTVTVECGPRYLIMAVAPIIGHLLPLVSDLELSALVFEWQADNQRAELGAAPRGVDMWFELARWAGVDLSSHQ